MITIAILAVVLLASAALSAMAAYRLLGSDAWAREYGADGMGLAIELAFLLLTFTAVAAVCSIMQDAFTKIFLDGGWRSPLYLGAAGAVILGVGAYMFVFAPRILAASQGIAPERVTRECRLPYLAYAPFSMISWAGLVLPLVAVILVSLPTDMQVMSEAKSNLENRGAPLAATVLDEDAETRLELYGLAHRDVSEQLQRMVGRYLWVVGVFMVFMVVILNTHITTIFTEAAQDAFKWLMWVLLLTAVGICAGGLERFLMFRELADGAVGGVLAAAETEGRLGLAVAAKTALLDLRGSGAVHFLVQIFEGGGLWLLFFSYVIQIVMAKITDRSVVRVIFPRPVASFLDAFMLSDEDGTK